MKKKVVLIWTKPDVNTPSYVPSIEETEYFSNTYGFLNTIYHDGIITRSGNTFTLGSPFIELKIERVGEEDMINSYLTELLDTNSILGGRLLHAQQHNITFSHQILNFEEN